MALTQNCIDRLISLFQDDLERAETLYRRIALDGATKKNGSTYSALRQPDRRDAAQFIFFEAAAQFETFCNEAFKIEVRHEFSIQPMRADYVMGNIDNGLVGVMGWASPTMLQSRAQALFGKNGFFGCMNRHIGQLTYLRLTQAHKIRNRIAHTGGRASEEFNKILGSLQVPQQSRKGLSVGRLLMDYPATSPVEDRWFYRFIAAYRVLSDAYQVYMRI